MAGIVSAPLPFLRKSEDPKPLHPRWGDVDISVPTEGSWNQYDNPHRGMREQQSYGPGFVPDCCPYDKEIINNNPQDGKRSHPTASSTNTTSSSRRNSLALGALRPGRLSVRLASRPKHLRRDSQTARQSQLMEPEKTEFAYKPIQQDYTAEAIENATQYQQQQQHSTRFKYIPTNGRYLEQLAPTTSNSQSVNSYRSSRLWRNSTMESPEDRGSDRDLPTTTYKKNIEDDRRSLRSSVGGDSSDSSTGPHHHVLPARRKTSPQVVTDRKRFSLLKPMTTAMVPAMDDLYE
ncbi:hypothetical protein N7474_008345 [Penicillium riverlandense]|uniref:uncharacterized protein n=1 Tax=Penicillium riverlandense TaxID=1903569 RepID=UPI00254945A4|nr:uncharacterized protein N7474_008345 [Penicillium riverlandense]KAJ5812044.1 hypothetical protein N7474_008345 [Penicillium riverlandense]